MPVDGVLIGTAAMATKEATTTDGRQAAPRRDPRHHLDVNGGWVGAGRSDGNVTSGRSQLGADIHEIDNAASRCGRAPRPGRRRRRGRRRAQGRARRGDGRAPAKPYFGDVAEMTYEQWLRRYVELPAPPGLRITGRRTGTGSTSPSATASRRCSTAPWRACTRRPPARSTASDADRRGTRPPPSTRSWPPTPRRPRCLLHPADVHFFVEVCRRPGKPVNFVPVIDADVRRWWRSDSLWQAHDESYGADQVIVIPGPVAVGGITVVDEPVADLLDRFEAAIVARALDLGIAPSSPPRAGPPWVEDTHPARRRVRLPRRGVGRTRGAEPAAPPGRPGPPGHSWSPTATSAAVLRVPLPQRRPAACASTCPGVASGRLPVISDDAATEAMGALLALTAGGTLPEVVDGTAETTAPGPPTCVADHIGVTSPAPPVAATGSPTRGAGRPRRAGGPGLARRLRLHRPRRGSARPRAPRPPHRADRRRSTGADGDLTIAATRAGVVDTTAGQVITVDVRDHRRRGRSSRPCPSASWSGAAPAPTSSPPRRPWPRTPRRPRARGWTGSPSPRPTTWAAFAAVSGDHNPLHTEVAAARLAGFDGPIVHGMWLSAVAQRAAASVGATPPPARRSAAGWPAGSPRCCPGAEVEITVERTGVLGGDTVVEVTCRVRRRARDGRRGASSRPRARRTPSRARASRARAWAWRPGPARPPPARSGTAPTSTPARPSASRSSPSSATTRPSCGPTASCTATPTACCS